MQGDASIGDNYSLASTTTTPALQIFGNYTNTGARNLKITSPQSLLSGFEFSALTNFPSGSNNYWTAVYAKQGIKGTYAGWFDGTTHVDAEASIGKLYPTTGDNFPTLEVLGNCDEHSTNSFQSNFKVINNNFNDLSGTQFSALTHIGNGIWSGLYSNSGTTSGNYAGYFDGNVKIISSSNNAIFKLQKGGGHEFGLIAHSDGLTLYDYSNTNSADILDVDNNGNIAIGMLGTGFQPFNAKLNINGDTKMAGTLTCQEVIVQAAVNFPDYVFEKDYNLMPLSEVEKFVNENKHLPEIPSADEINKNGNKVGDMQSLLLKKIEELTLYMIDLKKENEDFKQQISKLQK